MAVQLALGRALGREAPAHVLAPGAGGAAQIDDDVTGADQAQGFVNFLELVGRARAVALFLRQLDVGVVDVVVQPGFVDFLAFCLQFHGADCRAAR